MAWSFLGAASDGATSTTDTALSVAAPAGSGGQLVAIGVCAAARTITAPGAFASSVHLNGGGAVRRIYVWSMEDDAAGSYTFTVSGTFNDCSVCVLRFSGLDLSTLSATAAESTGSDTTAECPSETTDTADSLMIWAAGSSNGSTGSINNGATERVDFTGSTNGSCLHAYTANQASPGIVTGGVISTASYGRWVACSIECAPTVDEGGRTTRNTRSHPLGVRLGVGFRLAG